MKIENIISVKLNKKDRSSVVNVSYFYPEMNRNRDEEITDVPHRDFYKSINDLSATLATVFGSEAEGIYSATGFKRMKDNVVTITGKMIAANDAVVGIATPGINLEDDSFGFEADLKEMVDEICLETLLLLNGSKLGVQQLTIDDEIKKNESAIAPGEQGLFESALGKEEQTDEVDAVDYPDADDVNNTNNE